MEGFKLNYEHEETCYICEKCDSENVVETGCDVIYEHTFNTAKSDLVITPFEKVVHLRCNDCLNEGYDVLAAV